MRKIRMKCLGAKMLHEFHCGHDSPPRASFDALQSSTNSFRSICTGRVDFMHSLIHTQLTIVRLSHDVHQLSSTQ